MVVASILVIFMDCESEVSEHTCDCEDWKKDEKLCKELVELEEAKIQKYEELHELRRNCKYCSLIREYNAAIEQIKEACA